MIIVECYRDREWLYRTGFSNIRHAHNKGRVLEAVDRSRKAIGVIDEDPGSGRPKYLKEYEERGTKGGIKLLVKKGDDGKRIIQISPRLEDWLYGIAKRNEISPAGCGLPDDPGRLHSSSLKRDMNEFQRFSIAVNRASDDEIDTFKKWIREAIE